MCQPAIPVDRSIPLPDTFSQLANGPMYIIPLTSFGWVSIRCRFLVLITHVGLCQKLRLRMKNDSSSSGCLWEPKFTGSLAVLPLTDDHASVIRFPLPPTPPTQCADTRYRYARR